MALLKRCYYSVQFGVCCLVIFTILLNKVARIKNPVNFLDFLVDKKNITKDATNSTSSQMQDHKPKTQMASAMDNPRTSFGGEGEKYFPLENIRWP